MKIIEIKTLGIDAIKVITYARFRDARGYFTEHYRRSDFRNNPGMGFMDGVEFVQCNESYSRKGTLRGLHFQWNPYMGKLVRTVKGRMLDIVLDIRKGSTTFGRALLHEMAGDPASETDEWIWVPPGFAHGNVFPEDSVIEYLCSGEYSQGCEAGISPYAEDIDWTLCAPALKGLFDSMASATGLVTEKDRNGFTLKKWLSDERSNHFSLQSLA
ncbi:MAG: dTDP-4-dehydrorhamnose 3,5-epimerase family protein [Verrucomicrobiota bacterium]|jgi:dTDP-4-dehydrorhamnose 3,5-epimerase